MVAKKKVNAVKSSDNCMCGDGCHAMDSWLPAYLLICFGALALPINFGVLQGLEVLKAWPVLMILVGIVLVVKIELCRSRSKK
ncbi:MAG: DUF5668 domain-containing protein [Candidatus ainarchaeum sp.]|nr:DUF5668 domain-containing protein [Candidatus ainarchaeum sp.]